MWIGENTGTCEAHILVKHDTLSSYGLQIPAPVTYDKVDQRPNMSSRLADGSLHLIMAQKIHDFNHQHISFRNQKIGETILLLVLIYPDFISKIPLLVFVALVADFSKTRQC